MKGKNANSRLSGAGRVLPAALLAACALFCCGPLRAAAPGVHGKAAERALAVLYPLNGTLFPPEIAPPEFRWEAAYEAVGRWRINISFPAGAGLEFFSEVPRWRPPASAWEEIKERSLGKTAVFSVTPAGGAAAGAKPRTGRVSFSTSKDVAGAKIFYRVPLPFSVAVKDPALIRWRLGDISSGGLPPVVLEGLPVCGNCHSFSADGSVLGMDVDYANDKGSYAIVPVGEEMELDRSRVLTWSDYKREDKELTFGLLSQVSPDGRYVVSTVKDRSVFVARPDLAFSQLFFPVKGILAVYSREDGTFRALPGADDKGFVQSNPAWSPDGRYIVFARSRAYELKNLRNEASALLSPEECGEFLNGGKKFRYDLYRVPFNGGKGGRAEPLEGASENGMSNFFPRYSPDGKWLVFCKAESFMLLQPDSALYIMPAGGGKARRLRSNTPGMNSWHSWSPNGKWLVFSGKDGSPYTRLYLTHIDSAGGDTPPVLLDNFTLPDRAANIPEFVAPKAGLIKRIAEKFLDAGSFFRIGLQRLAAGDPAGAAEGYRKTLELDPGNSAAHDLLGVSLDAQGKTAEAAEQYGAAIKADPANFRAHTNLGILLMRQGRLDRAVPMFRKALELDPGAAMAHLMLGRALGMQSQLPSDRNLFNDLLRQQPGYAAHPAGRSAAGRRELLKGAIGHYAEAARLQPADAGTQFELALALDAGGDADKALFHFREAVKLSPGFAMARNGLALALEKRGELAAASAQHRAAVEIEPGVPILRYNLGKALELEGKKPEAAAAYREALRLDPGLPEAREALDKLQPRGPGR